MPHSHQLQTQLRIPNSLEFSTGREELRKHDHSYLSVLIHEQDHHQVQKEPKEPDEEKHEGRDHVPPPRHEEGELIVRLDHRVIPVDRE